MTTDRKTLAPAAPPTEKRVAGWRFWLPMAFQLLIVAAVPAPQVWAHATGTTVLLRTAPVDPYDVMRGRYMRLGYADQATSKLKELPGWQAATAEAHDQLWVEFAPAAAGKPWQAVAVHAERPQDLPAGHAAIRGHLAGGTVDWGMDQYYVPEDAGDGIEAAMRAAPRDGILVEARVGRNGSAVLEGLWIGGRRY